ncbi:hypothetical protein [Limnobacter sp.]|uniref:hypothetical protein n=1 Tax=Limnobacter sp. TaxID=2003368 RepID=UPI00351375C4
MSQFENAVTLDMSCTERELWRWLDELIARLYPMRQREQSLAEFQVDGGLARIHWEPLPDRVIALVRLKRLAVSIGFEAGVPGAERDEFVRQFRLHTLRGGG